MKLKLTFFLTLLLATLCFNFTSKSQIPECYFSFKSPSNLTSAEPDRLPEPSRKSRTVKTENGEVEVTCTDGYRILYNNDKNVPFVNLKVELSDKTAYENDQRKIIDNLRYLNSHSTNMETTDLIVLSFNGYKIYGLSRGTIETGSTLGIFVMFPGNDVTVYFYFNNLKPEFRNFNTLHDYKKQRDTFIEEYTTHLKACTSK